MGRKPSSFKWLLQIFVYKHAREVITTPRWPLKGSSVSQGDFSACSVTVNQSLWFSEAEPRFWLFLQGFPGGEKILGDLIDIHSFISASYRHAMRYWLGCDHLGCQLSDYLRHCDQGSEGWVLKCLDFRSGTVIQRGWVAFLMSNYLMESKVKIRSDPAPGCVQWAEALEDLRAQCGIILGAITS